MDNIQETKEQTEEFVIPESLKEVKNVPQGFVPVYFYEDKSELDRLSTVGFQRELNYMDEAKPEIEQIFDEARVSKGIAVDRGECLYAFPKHPDEIKGEFPFDPEKRVMLEVWVDPEKVLVADGEAYTEADISLSSWGSKERARDWADAYWDDSVTLRKYLDNPDKYSFNMIETLVPGPIPTDYMRVVENPKGNDTSEEY